MSKPRRWLWPCSDSKILRHKHYQNVVYESCPAADDDILWPGSDDELDEDERRRKKRRIESLAASYLSGNGLFVASAALRGPFEKKVRATKDKYANYIVGEPLLPDLALAPKHRPSRKAPATSSTKPTRKNTQKEDAAKDSRSNQKEDAVKDRQSKSREDRTADTVQSALPTPVRHSSFFGDRHRLPDRRTPDPQSDDSHTPTASPHTFTPSRPPQSSPSRLLSSLSKPSSVVPPKRKKSVRLHMPQEDHLLSRTSTIQSESLHEVVYERHDETHTSVANQPDSHDAENIPPNHNDSIMKDPCSPALPTDDDNSTESTTVASIAWNVAPPSAFTPINQPAANRSSSRQLPTNFHLDGTTLAETHFPQPSRNLMDSEAKQPASGTVGKLKKGRALKRKRNDYIEAVPTNDASPLLFRRKNEAAPKSSTSAANKDATVGASEPKTKKANPRRMFFNSSINVPSQPTKSPEPRDRPISSNNAPTVQSAPSPKPLTDQFAPAINMSFDQGSLAVNFDFIDRHTNNFLPASSNSPMRQVVSQQLRRAMRDSGASFTTSPFGGHLPAVESPSSPTRYQQPSAVIPTVLDPPSLAVPNKTAANTLYRSLIVDGIVSDSTEMETINAERAETERAEVEKRETEKRDTEEKEAGKVETERTEAERTEVERTVVEQTEIGGTEFERTELERTELSEEDEEDLPYISTQAAMQDAHHGLFDPSSPENTRTKPRVTEQATPGLQQDRTLVHDIAITPFHEFHAKIAAEKEEEAVGDMQSPPANTQALFDDMSPFLSPEKPKIIPLKKQKSKKRASFAPILEENNDISVLLSPKTAHSPADVHNEENSHHSSISIQSQQNSSGRQTSERSSAIPLDRVGDRQGHQEDEPSRQAGTDFPPSSVARSRSSSPDIIWSQRSGPPASQRVQPFMPHEQSVRVSDMIQELQSSRGSQILIDNPFSTNSSRTSKQKGRSSGVSARRPAAKSRLSAQSGRRSSGRTQPQESSSQPEKVRKRSLRSRTSLSQAEPSSLQFVSTPTEQRLTGNTTIADETVSLMQPPVSTEDLQSSNLIRNSLLNHTPSGQVNGIVSVPTTSARSKKLFSTIASSHQAAQRAQDLDLDDLDSTLDDIMKPVGSWDVEREMGRPLTASVG